MNPISVAQLHSSIAAHEDLIVLDVRRQPAYRESTEMIAGALRRDPEGASTWCKTLPRAASVAVYCVHGHEVSQGVARTLQSHGIRARYLEGGLAAWKEEGGALDSKPAAAATRWVTRERPKIDRIACPWLIARFIDPAAEFLYVPTSKVRETAKARDATAYDIADVYFTHEGERCSFDAFIRHYRLGADPALERLAVIVRGADTARLDLAPQAAGLAAVSLGLSRLCMGDDQRMLAHGFIVYDALYEWLKHGRAEQHGWNGGKGKVSGEPPWDRLTSGDVEVHISARRVVAGGKRVKLPPKEFALLVTLVARAGRVLTRRFLLRHVWAYEADVESRTVDWHVASLRRRLGTAGEAIETIRGEGYRWREA